MSRVGWVVLAGILLVAGLFAVSVRLGPAELPRVRLEAVAAPRGDLVMPVAGVARSAITDTWGQARSEGREHHGTDIVAPADTPVLAAAAGRVEKLFKSRLGGTTLYERSANGRWIFYYAHLARYAPGVHEGQQVAAGQLLGYVGDTGDAGEGNYHLHFSLTRMTPGQGWWQGKDVNAFPYLSKRKPLP